MSARVSRPSADQSLAMSPQLVASCVVMVSATSACIGVCMLLVHASKYQQLQMNPRNDRAVDRG